MQGGYRRQFRVSSPRSGPIQAGSPTEELDPSTGSRTTPTPCWSRSRQERPLDASGLARRGRGRPWSRPEGHGVDGVGPSSRRCHRPRYRCHYADPIRARSAPTTCDRSSATGAPTGHDDGAVSGRHDGHGHSPGPSLPCPVPEILGERTMAELIAPALYSSAAGCTCDRRRNDSPHEAVNPNRLRTRTATSSSRNAEPGSTGAVRQTPVTPHQARQRLDHRARTSSDATDPATSTMARWVASAFTLSASDDT